MKIRKIGLVMVVSVGLTPMAFGAQENELAKLCIDTTGSEGFCECYVETMVEHIGPENIPHVVRASREGLNEFEVAEEFGYLDAYKAAKDAFSANCQL